MTRGHIFDIGIIALVAGGMVAFFLGNLSVGGILYAFPAGVAAGQSIYRLVNNGRV